jgi:hypothetical protein
MSIFGMQMFRIGNFSTLSILTSSWALNLFHDRNVHLADIEWFRPGVLDQIEHHCDLIAAVELMTVDAIHPDFARHRFVRDNTKTQFGEKLRDVSERVYLNELVLASLRDVRFDEGAPYASSSGILIDGERANLSHVAPGEMQPGATEHSAIFGGYVKITDVLINMEERARQHLLLVGVIIDERVNLNGVAGIGLSDLHLFFSSSLRFLSLVLPCNCPLL